jgi:cell wall-associated NlpC family hydrolase
MGLAGNSIANGIGRRAATVAAAGGILATTITGATAAQAAPLDIKDDAAKSTLDLGAISEQARAALETAPVVTVAADAKVSVETMKVDIKPAPKPKPVPEPEPAAVEDTTSSTTQSAASPAEESPSVAVAGSGLGAEVASIALRYVGTPYVVGGATPAGFDCSGLVVYVYAQVGIDLPHQSTAILDSPRTTVISASEAQPGDLLWSPGHIGIYIGDGKQVDASRPDGWNTDIRPIWQSNPTYLRVS